MERGGPLVPPATTRAGVVAVETSSGLSGVQVRRAVQRTVRVSSAPAQTVAGTTLLSRKGLLPRLVWCASTKLIGRPHDNALELEEVSMPSYQTVALAAYQRELQRLASDLHERALLRIPEAQVRSYPGSYSVIGSTTPETVAKILIYERGIGTEEGVFPPLRDGVYVFVRVNGTAEDEIWREEVQQMFPAFFRMMSPTTTLGIAPQRAERFAYFEAIRPTDSRLKVVYDDHVALLLDACHRLC